MTMNNKITSFDPINKDIVNYMFPLFNKDITFWLIDHSISNTEDYTTTIEVQIGEYTKTFIDKTNKDIYTNRDNLMALKLVIFNNYNDILNYEKWGNESIWTKIKNIFKKYFVK